MRQVQKGLLGCSYLRGLGLFHKLTWECLCDCPEITSCFVMHLSKQPVHSYLNKIFWYSCGTTKKNVVFSSFPLENNYNFTLQWCPERLSTLFDREMSCFAVSQIFPPLQGNLCSVFQFKEKLVSWDCQVGHSHKKTEWRPITIANVVSSQENLKGPC